MSTIPAISQDRVLREKFDQRPLYQVVIDKIVAFVKEIFYCIYLGLKMLFGSQNYNYLDKNYAWENKESKGLFVLLHGLFAHPNCWDTHTQLIGNEYDVYNPFVPSQGICPLKDAVDPIYKQVRKYALMFPGKKICLIGHSNGSRLADEIERRFREEFPSTPIRVSTIAGVHLGSPVQATVSFCMLDRCFSTELSEEMAYESAKAQEIFENLKKPLEPNVAPREYEFFASLDDILVPSIDSSLPTLGKNETHYAVGGVGHCYLIEQVAEQQIINAKKWFNEELVAV